MDVSPAPGRDMTGDANEDAVLKRYARHVVCMRRAHQARRFGLILGAGG
jgi:hypothetical protein